MNEDHAKYHSPNAFCGNAGPEEMKHMHSLIDKLTDEELKRLVKNCGIDFIANEEDLTREDYEGVVDEAGREDFYRVYESIISSRKEKSKRTR